METVFSYSEPKKLLMCKLASNVKVSILAYKHEPNFSVVRRGRMSAKSRNHGPERSEMGFQYPGQTTRRLHNPGLNILTICYKRVSGLTIA